MASRAGRIPGKAENLYRPLFEQRLAAIFWASLEGRVVDLNENCARMLGYHSRDEAKCHSLQEIVASPSDFDRLIHRLREDKSINNLEFQLRHAGGQPLWVTLDARLVESSEEPYFLGTLIDITKWKQTEEALRLSENRFRALVERSSDAISMVDGQGKIIYSSHAVSPIFGYQLEERMGKDIFELVHAEDLAHAKSLFQGLLQSPFGSVATSLRYQHKDGSWRWIEALGTNLLEDASVKAVVINYRDVTERRQLEEQLFQVQKMEAIGQLAGGLAHDFNNLLTAILGYSDMVMEKLPRNSLLGRYTAEIKKAGERAASLTRQLLAFSRLQVMALQVLDLNAAISDMQSMLGRVMGEDIILLTVPGAMLGRIKADPFQVEQVILNLAVNAKDAMPQGGRLILRTSNVVLERGFTEDGASFLPGAYVLLEVEDTGCGMDSKTRARIFEPFFTTKEKGTGLGLSTVYGIVKQSGGYIRVYSEPGGDTTFKIYLPRVEEALTSAKPAEAPPPEPAGNETVLVVEDDNIIGPLVRRVLRSKGYQVLEAKSAAEGLARCKRYKKPIQLLVTDAVMPPVDGRELARRIGALHPQTKVLYMTGCAGNEISSAGLPGEHAQFIQKPFSAEALAHKIRSILDGR